MAPAYAKEERLRNGRAGRERDFATSLRFPILILILLAIAPLLAGRFWQISRDADASIASAREQAVRLAELAAEQHEELIARARTFLSVLVRVPVVKDALVDQCHMLLRDLARAAPWQRRTWVIRPDGKAACTSHAPIADLDVADREYFQKAIRSRGFVVSDFVITRIRNQPAIIAALPAFDEDDELQIVALVTLDLEAAEHPLKAMGSASVATLMVDSRNVVISWRGSDPANRSDLNVVGTKLPDGPLARIVTPRLATHGEGAGPDGVDRIWGVARLASPEGVVAVGLSRSEVLAQARSSVLKSVVASAVIALVAAIAAWIGAEFLLLRNIRALVATARRIGSGDAHARVKLPRSAGELHLIARALQAMASQIAERDAQLQRSQLTLAEKTRVLEATLDHMDQGLIMADENSVVQVCNHRALELLDLPPALMLSRPHFSKVTAYQIEHDEFRGTSAEFQAWVAQKGFEATHHVYERERPNGRVLEVRTVPLPGGGAVRTFTDITKRKAAERQISHTARHDTLTNLPNRLLFRERLHETLAAARRADQKFAVLWLDLDRFKAVNDALGHPIGDALLVAVADRLRGALRGHDVVARLGGDEFAVLQLTGDQPNAAAAMAKRIVDELARPFELHDHQLYVGGSVGIAIWPSDGTNADELLKNADLALYRAKDEGRCGFRFFEPEMDAQVEARRTLELELRKGLSEGRFELHYQPLIAVREKRVTAFEALIRWRHPQRGLVHPAEFIPLAEETRLIVQLGHWALQEACREAASWPNDVGVAVNISAVQFASGGLGDSVHQALHDSGLRPARLELEITESVLIGDPEAANRVFAELRLIGVRVALDDFGTGYSSLSYLRSFPFDKIKIDRSFVRELATVPESLAIFRIIVSLGATLGIPICAEGVETAEQYEVVRALGCTEVQGYLFGVPKPADEALAILAPKGIDHVA